MRDRFTMWHSETGAQAETTGDAYDAVWFPRGWRESPPRNPQQHDGSDPAPSGEDSEEEN